MVTRPPTCPKCSGKMEKGFVLDRSFNENRQGQWIEGPPTKLVWGGVKTRGRVRLPVTSLRCVTCGYVESYALAE